MQRDPRQDFSQHDLHFVHRKYSTNTVTNTTAEREEVVWTDTFAIESVWIKSVRIGPDIWIMMGQINTRGDHNTSRQVLSADIHRLMREACNDGHDRMHALRFFDRGVEIFELGDMLGFNRP